MEVEPMRAQGKQGTEEYIDNVRLCLVLGRKGMGSKEKA